LNSAYRCVEHNRKIGGIDNSFHVQGKAIDLSMKGKTKEVMNILADRAQRIGFMGIGCYYSKSDGHPVFLHLDIGTGYFRSWEKTV